MTLRDYAEQIKQFAGAGLGIYEMCSATPAGGTAPTKDQIVNNIVSVVTNAGVLFPLPAGITPSQAGVILANLGPVLEVLAP